MASFANAGESSETINPKLLNRVWPAEWIAHPTASSSEFGVFLFRKGFNLAKSPAGSSCMSQPTTGTAST